MSEEFAFLDELLSDLPPQTYASNFPINEAINPVEPSRKPTGQSELEIKLRKENAKLRCFYKHYRKTLNEREARLTELLKEKLSMTEEKERIEDWKKKLEEANVHKEATEQLNKQLHELAKTFEHDKITLGNKIHTLQKKARKLKKELNGRAQQLLQERKRRQKLLKIIVELSDILISVGLLPVKYKKSLDGWKFEVNLNEDDAEGDDDLEEKIEEEELKDEKSSPKSIAQVLASNSIEPPQAVSIGPKDEAPLAVMSDSESSGDEGCETSLPPAKNPPRSASVVDSVKTLYKHMVGSKEDVLRIGSDFGSTVMSPCSSVSVGEQCGAENSLVRKPSSGSPLPVLSPSTFSRGKSVNSDSGRTEKSVTLSSEEDNWHWDESSQDLPLAGSSGVNGTDKETRTANLEKKEEKFKKRQYALEKSCDSSNSLDVSVILAKMHINLPSLLEPFEVEYDAPFSSKSVVSSDWPSTKTLEKLTDGATSRVLFGETIEWRVDANSSVSCVTINSSSLNLNNKLSADRIPCENTENNKGISSAVKEVGATITAGAIESSNSDIASPIRNRNRSEKKSKRRHSKKLALNVVDGTYSGESCDDVQQTKKGEVDEVYGDLSTTVSTTEGECDSQMEDMVNPIGERSKRGRGRPRKFSGEEQGVGDKSKDKKHPKSGMEENAVKNKSSAKNLSPIKEECQRRFSLRLRSNKPVTEGICPNIVNNNVEVPSEEDSESSLDNNPARKLTKTKAKSQKPKITLPLVDYSDTSDTCDSVLPTVQDVEDRVFAEPVNIMENSATVADTDIRGPAKSELMSTQKDSDSDVQVGTHKGMNVICNSNGDIRGSAKSELMSMQKESDSGVQMRTHEGMNVKCNSNGDIPCIADDRIIIPNAKESSKLVQKYNELEMQMDLGDSSSTGDVVSLPMVEKSPAPVAHSECSSVKENDTSILQLVNNNDSVLNNNDSLLVADSEELGGNSCNFKKDHGSDRSETESNSTVSIFNSSEELSQDGGIVSGLNSPFSFSSDESGDEYSDALSVFHDDEDSSSISVHSDANENNANLSIVDLGKFEGTVPSLSDGISSTDKSLEKANPSVSVTNDSRSPPNNQEESVVPMHATLNSQMLKGVVLMKEGIRNESHDKRSSLENKIIASKNILCDPKEVLSNSVISEGNKTTESIDSSLMGQPSMQNPVTCPLTNSISSVPLEEGNHSLDGTCKSVLMPNKTERKSKKSSRQHNHDKKKMTQTETITPLVMNKENAENLVENPAKVDPSPRGFNRGNNDIKNSPASFKVPARRKSVLSFGTGPLKKIMSFFGENSSSTIAVPFFFKKLNLFKFPGVKFSLRGHLAPEFYRDLYSFPKHPLLSFGGSDFEEFYQMLQSIVADKSCELQHLGIKFYKRGSFAPPHFTDLYLNPGRLAINFGHERRMSLKSHKEEDSPLKEAECSGILSASCLPDHDSVGTNEIMDSDNSNTICNDSENNSEISVDDDLPVGPGDFNNDFMVIDQVSSCTSARTFETCIQNVPVSQKEKFNADSSSWNDYSGRLQTNHQGEIGPLRLHKRDQIPPGHGLVLTSPVTSQKSCIVASVILRDLTLNGESASNIEPEERITDKKYQTERTDNHGGGEMVTNHEVESVGVTMSSRISSHKSLDSIFIKTNSRESYSTGGYSSDKEDSPSGSVVDVAVNRNDCITAKFLKESSGTNIQPNTPAKVDLNKPSSSLKSAEVTFKNTNHDDSRPVNDAQHTSVFTDNKHSEVDLIMADNGSRSHLTGGGLDLQGENNHNLPATHLSKDHSVDGFNEIQIRDKAEGVTQKSSAIPDGFTMDRVKGQTPGNENCILTTDLEYATSDFKNLRMAKDVEKTDNCGLVGDVGIDDLMMVICPDGRIPEVTLKSDGSNVGEIFGENDGNLLHMNLPLDIAPFPAKQGEEKQNFMTLLTHVNGNKSKEPCKEKMAEEVGSQIGNGIFNTSFSDESAYSSMSKSALSGPDSVETTQIPSSHGPYFNSREKAAEAMHIDKYLMAENLDDLIELAGGLHSFDDGCLGSDPTEVSESVPEANILTKTSATSNSNIGNENGVNQLGAVTSSYEDPVQNPESSDNFTAMPTYSKETEKNPISLAESQDELKKDASNVETDDGACDSPLTSDKQRGSALQDLVCHSGNDSSNTVINQDQLRSDENCSLQSCVSHLCDKRSYDSTELAAAVNERKGGTLVKTHSSDGLKNLVVGSGDSLVGDGGEQSKDVNGIIIENFDNTNSLGLLKSAFSQSVCVERKPLSVHQTNSATNAVVGVENVNANELDHGSPLQTRPAIEGITVGGMETVELQVLPQDEVVPKGDKTDSTPPTGRTPRKNTLCMVKESATSKVCVQGNGNDSILVMNPSSGKNDKLSNLALSPGKEQGSERMLLSDEMKNVKMKDVIKVDSTEGHAIPKSPDCGSVSNESPKEPGSLISSATLSMEKKNIVTKAAKKDLFGTDSSDSSSDSVPLANLLIRKLRKRKTNILSSESDNECDKRRKVSENEVEHLPTKKPVVRLRRTKSVRSKYNVIFGSPVTHNDSDESPFESDHSTCQPQSSGVKNKPNSGGSHEEMGRNSDKVGETNYGPHEVTADSSNSGVNVNSNLFLADMVIGDGIKLEDNGQLVPSVNVVGKSHVPLLHVPSRPRAASSAGTVLPCAYASRMSNSPIKRPSMQVTPPKVEEINITLPDSSIDAKYIQVDDGLNTTVNPSSPEEEKTFLNVDKKDMSPQKVEKRSETPGRRQTRKQSFVDSLKCDDAVILSVEDLNTMAAESRRPKRRRIPKTEKNLESTAVPTDESNAKTEKVCVDGKGDESSECISSIPQISVAEDDSFCIDNNMLDVQDATKAATVPDLTAVSPSVRKARAAKYGKKYYESEGDDSGKDSSNGEDVKLKPTSAAKGDVSPVHCNTSNSHTGEKLETDGRSSEKQDGIPLLNEEDPLEAVTAGMCKENKRRGVKSKKEASSSNDLNEKDISKVTSISKDGEDHQTSEKLISDDPKKSPFSVQDSSLFVNDTLSNFLSNENCNDVEAGSGEESEVYSSRKGALQVSRVSGKGKKIPVKNCNPKIMHLKEDVNEGDKKYLEESSCVQTKKRIAHVPKASPAVAEIRPPSVNKDLTQSNSEEKNEEHEITHYDLPYKKKKFHSKSTAKGGKLIEDQGNVCESKTPSKEKKNEDAGNSKEQQSSLPLKKRIANFPNKSAGVTKPTIVSPSNKIISEEMDVDGNIAVEGKDMCEPQIMNRIAHALKTTSQIEILNAHPPVNKFLSGTGINGHKKETVDCPEQGYGPPSKKRIAHIPKGPAITIPNLYSSVNKNSSLSVEENINEKINLGKNEPYSNPSVKKRVADSPKTSPKTSNADSFDSSLSETESLPDLPRNQPRSTKSPASKVKKGQKSVRPKGKMSKLSKLRTLVSRVRGYCPPNGPSDASTSRALVHRGGGCCSRKNLPCRGDGDCMKKSFKSEQPTRKSLRKKAEDCGPSPKKRRTCAEAVKTPQPAKLKRDNQLKAGSPTRSLPGLDEGEVTLKSPQKEAEIVKKEKSSEHVLQTPLVSPLKEEVNSGCIKKDALSIEANQEKILEEMEVPPLSPLSEDAFVDSLIEFPDSSESMSDVEIDQTPETPNCVPKKVVEVKCQLDLGKEVPVTNSIEGKQEGTKVLAGKSMMEISSKMTDGASDTVECSDMVAKDYAPLLQGVHISFDAKDLVLGEYEVTAESSDLVPLQINASSVVDRSNADSHGNTVTPSQLRETLESISYNWHNSTDYFNKMLTKITQENAEIESTKKAFPHVTRDKRRILKSQLKRLNGQYFGNKVLNEILAIFDDPSYGFRTKHIAKYLIRMLSKEDEDDVQSPVLRGAPRMTRFQMRALSLILVLENRCPQFKDICSLIFRGIQFTLFRLGHCPVIEVVKTLARMYTALSMAKRDIWRVRCFIFDALFAIDRRSAALISVVLSMWHEVLPRQEPDREPSHLESSFYMAISHFQEKKSTPEDLLQCMNSLKMILRNVYQSEHYKKTYDQFLEELLVAMREGKNLNTLEPAMVIVGKRQGWEWTHKNLLLKNLVSIMGCWKNSKPSQSAAVLAIRLIGLLSRSCPLETCGPVKNIIESLSHTLVKEPCDDPSIKEALIMSLICLSRYHTYHIVRALDIWRPMREPPEEVVKAIKGFVLRDTMQAFWKKRYRNWKKGGNQHKVPHYFERSTPLKGSEVPLEENEEGVGDCSGIEGNAEVNGGAKKRWAPKGNRLKYEEWLKDQTNAESIKGEVKEWDRVAFSKNNRRKKKKNKPKMPQT